LRFGSASVPRGAPGRRDVKPVGRPSVHHLGVAGDDRDTRKSSGLGHVGDQGAQFLDRKALLDYEGGGYPFGFGAHHRQIVDCAVHRQMSYGPTRKTKGLHDERIGGERDALAGRKLDEGGVGQRAVSGSAERFQEDGVYKGRRGLPSCAMG